MNPVRYLQVPQRVGSKLEFLTFCVAFYMFVAGNRRHFKFGMPIEHSKSQSTDDKLSLKGAWSRSSDLFKAQF